MAYRQINFMVNKIHDRELEKYINKYCAGKLLDVGCGSKPYEKFTIGVVDKHIGIDHELTPHDKSRIDVFGTAYDIPFEDNHFDAVLCTAVLEHLEEPNEAIKESNRILKKGGVAIYSVPFIWHLHEEPRDFFRYSKYGLEYLFMKNGFDIVELKSLSGFWVTSIQLFIYYLERFNRGLIRRLGVLNFFFYLMQKVGLFINKYDRSKEWTWMYIVIAQKK